MAQRDTQRGSQFHLIGCLNIECADFLKTWVFASDQIPNKLQFSIHRQMQDFNVHLNRKDPVIVLSKTMRVPRPLRRVSKRMDGPSILMCGTITSVNLSAARFFKLFISCRSGIRRICSQSNLVEFCFSAMCRRYSVICSVKWDVASEPQVRNLTQG
jgi:hypothetical protein